jgi:hypothetical protein
MSEKGRKSRKKSPSSSTSRWTCWTRVPGPFSHKGKNAIDLQKFIGPWCIAQYGLDYPKKLTLDSVKEIVLAISDDKGLLQGFPSAAVPAKKYVISFADDARKVKNAAGAYI